VTLKGIDDAVATLSGNLLLPEAHHASGLFRPTNSRLPASPLSY